MCWRPWPRARSGRSSWALPPRRKQSRAKLLKKNLDMIAANEVGDNKVFECEDNHLIVLWRNARRDLGHGTKLSLARELVRLIAESYTASLAGATQRDSAQA
jgi:phosphopantothenoylcysteine synthetase/decarboxylase